MSSSLLLISLLLSPIYMLSSLLSRYHASKEILKTISIFCQPTFACSVVRHGLSNECPEGGLVVAFTTQVDQLMDDDIVDDGRGKEHSAPVEVENVVTATGGPVIAKRLDFDGPWLSSNSVPEEIDALLKPDPSLCDIPVGKVRFSLINSVFAEEKTVIAQFEGRIVEGRDETEAITATKIGQASAVDKSFVTRWFEQHFLTSQFRDDQVIFLADSTFNTTLGAIKRSGEDQLSHASDGDADGFAPGTSTQLKGEINHSDHDVIMHF